MVEESVPERRSPTRDRLVVSLRERNLAAPVAVAGLLLVAVAARIAVDRHVHAPWIMLDELQYADAARSFAADGHYLFRDHPYALPTIYPALISPAWFAGSVQTAYTLVKTINVLLMVAGAIPLYLWARRLVAPVWTVVAVVLYLAIPGFMYTAEILTENAFVPELGRGASLSSGFGVYTPIATAHYALRPAVRWIVYSFGELGFSVGLIPVSALIVLLGLACRRETAPSSAERAFIAVATAAVSWIVIQVGTFASHFALRVEERNMFNVAPVLL